MSVGQFQRHSLSNDLDGILPNKLDLPAICVVRRGTACDARCRRARARIKKPAIGDCLDANFVAHTTGGVFSQKCAIVLCFKEESCSRRIQARRIPAISKSEFDTVPFGFVSLMIAAVMLGG